MTEPTSMPSQIRAGTPLGFRAVALGLVAAVAGLSSPTAGASIAGVLLKLLTATWPAAAYLAGSVGLGRVARPLYAGVRDELLVQGGVGLALMLVLGHVLGQVGHLMKSRQGNSGWVLAGIQQNPSFSGNA